MNPKKSFLFTVDVEDWFQVENFKTSIRYDDWDRMELRVERNTHRLLDLLDAIDEGEGLRGTKAPRSTQPTNQINQRTNQTDVHATFFILGWVAERLPLLVKEISRRGHEVASHGMRHRLCSEDSPTMLKEDLERSRKMLEDITGSSVFGYRAPSFSISDDILGLIAEAGYQYDASYNAFDKHGRYGRLTTEIFQKAGIAYRVHDGFYELPVSNITLRHSVLPWGGGGYFRLLPYAVFRSGVRRILKKDNGYHFYMHPWELDPDQPRVEKIPAALKFRHYVNLATTAGKIRRMLSDFSGCRFVTCRDYIQAVATDRR